MMIAKKMMSSTTSSSIHCCWRSSLLVSHYHLYLPSSSSSSSSSSVIMRLLSSAAPSSASAAAAAAASNASSHQQHEQQLSYNRDTGIISDAQSMQQLYQTIIGIEIHAQLSIPTKLFSLAPTRHNADGAAANGNNNNIIIISSSNNKNTNNNIHPFDIAYPGTLPTGLSNSAIQASILSAASLNCRNIHPYSKFERKHYFYADLPHGYQITQQRWPLASEGLVSFLPFSNQHQQHQHQQHQDRDQSGGGKKKKRRRGRDGSNNKPEEDDSSNDDVKQEQHTTTTTTTAEPVQLRIERIQIEQDTGKTTTHTPSTTSSDGITTTTTTAHIDYNRAGCALIEIVSYPDLRSAHEAAGVVEKIRKLLKHVGSCDGKMEEGSLRCDLNVSIAPIQHDTTTTTTTTTSTSTTNDNADESSYNLPPGNGHRVEVKNLNSLRQIIAATEYEALRQSSLAIQHKPTGRETRTFHVKPADPLGGETVCIRAKGDAVDYRFMPEPDLPPLILDEVTLGGNMTVMEFIERFMPESAEDATARLVEEYSLGESVATLIASDPPAIVLFEDAVSVAKSELHSVKDDYGAVDTSSEQEDNINESVVVPALVANFLCNDLYALIKKSATEEADEDEDKRATLLNSISVDQSTVNSQRLGLLIAMIVNGKLTTSMAKKILTIMYKDDLTSSPSEISTTNGWEVISDMDVLTQLCTDVVHDIKNTKQLEQYRQGGKNTWKIEKFFVGKVMAQSNGNAHPEKMKEALASVLVSDQS